MIEYHMFFTHMTHRFKPQALLLFASFPVLLSHSALATTGVAEARFIIDALATTAIFLALALLYTIIRQHVLLFLPDLFRISL
jgi:hypothetical protein